MPKFEQQGNVVGEGTIKIKTIQRGEEFDTTFDVDLKNVNTEGLIIELDKLSKKLYEEELCSDGKTCEQCEKLVPNYFVNTLCLDCYKKVDEGNKTEKRMEKLGQEPEKEIERPKMGEADVSPLG